MSIKNFDLFDTLYNSIPSRNVSKENLSLTIRFHTKKRRYIQKQTFRNQLMEIIFIIVLTALSEIGCVLVNINLEIFTLEVRLIV